MRHYETYHLEDDFQRRIEKIITENQQNPNFPQKHNDLTEEELSNYLFDYQAALDTEGSEKSKYTKAGFMLLLPFIVLHGIPEHLLPVKGALLALLGLAIGLTILGIYKVIIRIIIRRKLNSINNTYKEVADYVSKVIQYANKINS